MYEYAALASIGDNVYHDPTTAYESSTFSRPNLNYPSFSALEAHIAKLTGKQAAIFMPSGTASNQIALRTHLHQPPYSVLCDKLAHIHA